MSTSPTLAEPKTDLATAQPAAGGEISAETLQRFGAEFGAEPAYRIAQNAVTQTTVDDVALNRFVITSTDHTFSHLLDDWEVTNQKKSGRC